MKAEYFFSLKPLICFDFISFASENLCIILTYLLKVNLKIILLVHKVNFRIVCGRVKSEGSQEKDGLNIDESSSSLCGDQ